MKWQAIGQMRGFTWQQFNAHIKPEKLSQRDTVQI
jgi:hypothetical protein